MSKPDNHVDETLEDILFEYENGQNPHQDEDYRFERTKAKLDEHYKKKYLALVPEKKPIGMTPYSDQIAWARAYNEAIDEMTNNINQFNSNGDSDE